MVGWLDRCVVGWLDSWINETVVSPLYKDTHSQLSITWMCLFPPKFQN